MKKISLIVTVLNEAKTITQLLDSIPRMNGKPDEVIIVDGGSSDETVKLASDFAKAQPNISLKVFKKTGNRSLGRNFAISKARNEWIAITDAGCIPEKNWLKELVKRQQKLGAKVVAGYYSAKTTTPFEEAVVPYVLVMPDKINKDDFLPATRSMLISKQLWKNVGGFNEKLTDNEDYDFAKRIKSSGVKIGFAKNAQVIWIPRSTLGSFVKMIFRFARGDAFAGIIRPKVLLIFVRYLFGTSLILATIWYGNLWLIFGLIASMTLIYILWSIYKNFRYVARGKLWLPILQITSDLAVMWGSVAGLVKRILSVKITKK